MNFLKKKTFLLLTAISLFSTLTVVSQNMLQQDPNPALEEAAREKAEMWKDELALTSKQRDLMERKLVEFAIKKNRLLQSKMREDAKTERLKRLQVLENKDMRDILTQPQYDRYIVLLEKQIRQQGSR